MNLLEYSCGTVRAMMLDEYTSIESLIKDKQSVLKYSYVASCVSCNNTTPYVG